jgi:hypothetical protein
MTAADNLGPLAQESPRDVVLVLQRRREMVAERERMARVKPLGRPLSTGEPARARLHLEAAS